MTDDQLGALDDFDDIDDFDGIDPRYHNNLFFYGLSDADPIDCHQSMRGATALVLGAGGIGSAVLSNLLGLGIGKVILVDDDTVERSNLNRQFLFEEADVGRAKVVQAVARAKRLNQDTQIEPVQCRISDGSKLRSLLRGADLVVVAIDDPPSIRWVVNQACVEVGVPFITGGIAGATGIYLAVAPERGPCLECLMPNPQDHDAKLKPTLVNTSIGPLTTLLAGLISLEALRFLTDVAPPVAIGQPWIINGLTGEVQAQQPWQTRPDCPVCSMRRSTAAATEAAAPELRIIA